MLGLGGPPRPRKRRVLNRKTGRSCGRAPVDGVPRTTEIIAASFRLNPVAVLGGPEWIDSERYDITALTPNSVRPNLDEQMTMLRKLLIDRFGLQFHREQKCSRCMP